MFIVIILIPDIEDDVGEAACESVIPDISISMFSLELSEAFPPRKQDGEGMQKLEVFTGDI